MLHIEYKSSNSRHWSSLLSIQEVTANIDGYRVLQFLSYSNSKWCNWILQSLDFYSFFFLLNLLTLISFFSGNFLESWQFTTLTLHFQKRERQSVRNLSTMDKSRILVFLICWLKRDTWTWKRLFCSILRDHICLEAWVWILKCKDRKERDWVLRVPLMSSLLEGIRDRME